jgi:hypothetical protein
VRAKLSDPDNDATFRDQLERIFSRPLGMLEEASQDLSTNRELNRKSRDRIAELQEHGARKELELKALRGDRLTVEDVQPAAPRAGRRPRSTRR